MIIYLDTSALVKRYIKEPGTDAVRNWISSAEVSATSLITHTEMAAAIAKTRRMGFLNDEQARRLWRDFLIDWTALGHVEVTEFVITRASNLAWDFNLRGYDAVHLACALSWQERVDGLVTFVSFDRVLWQAGRQVGLEVLPQEGENSIVNSQ